ncbi:hypothetical protein GCM10011380_00620 [Sphingomonas metalli]|uniref:Uncharacterized protein n=1 Tax=Sphingomonas metalli TaxID=1779358 RepID=A0A916WNE6_9SPHN|nr:hypothetical protein [Sphingomonas metalli]GGB15086.1 hypothetical protein GCM10011380_00620 [Sphingomonas metalli]
MIVDNGAQVELFIPGVFQGTAGTARDKVWFVPNKAGVDPATARAGMMDGKVVRLEPAKDAEGPGWTSRYTVQA